MDEQYLLDNNIVTNPVHRRLLRKKEVIDEINRHLWIESEKTGYNIGFERAALDWLERFSQAWMEYHMPKSCSSSDTAKPKKHSKNSHRGKSKG